MLRRFIPLAALVALAVAPAVAAVGFNATAPIAVSATGVSPFGGSSCTNEDLSGQQAHSTLYLNGEVEPWVATHSTNAVAADQQDRWNDGGSRGIVTQRSTTSGATWTQNTTTYSSFCTGGTVANGGDFQRATDPWTAISPNGNTYLMTLSIDDPNTSADHAMLVMKSTDYGATWGTPTTLIRENLPAVLNDKNSITADPNSSSYVYAVWDRLELPNEHVRAAAVANAFPFTGPALFSRTTNGGGSWSTPKVIFATKGSITQTIGNQIVVLPDLNDGTFEGQLIDGFTYRTLKMGGNVFGFDNVALTISDDHGATWATTPIIVSKLYDVGVVDPDNGDPVRSEGDIAEFAVDPNSGALYAVWEDGRFSGFAYNEVAFSQSTDGGFTWSTPIKINKTPAVSGLNKQAFVPSVDVLSDGTVGVTYYDFRNNSGATAALETDYFLVHCHAASDDCLDTTKWSETPITSASFDLRKAPVARGLFLGDYVGLSNFGTNFLAFFTQSNSTGDPATEYASNVGP